ncbi:MAG TPA: hypothetical protein VL328_16670 [Gemmatimonadaceae bacterium]|jgi:hypothetical protein|nr:hypothetical protein [Gemmatimonadaceae bacterium]
MTGTAKFHSVRSSLLGAVLLLAAASVPSLAAQQVDSAQVGARRTPRDSTRALLPKPPLSPRRAFLYSLVVPGYSQSVLGRPTAGAIFVLTEGIALAMLHESAADLRQARRLKTDSLIVIGVDPGTGSEITQTSGYTQELIDVRRGHVEDWLAFLIANHLLAAADAYVAAHLWDLPTQVSVERRPAGTVVAAKVSW